MDMMFVLGILTVIFFTCLIIMCFYRSKINIKLWNLIFIIADFIAYSCWNYASYQRGWLADGWMTLENISPLMFTIILLTPFMNEKIRNYAYSTIAFLCVGMLFAMYISPEHSYLFSYNTEASFLYTSEALCHMLCSLFGIYLVLSNQVKADIKHWLRSMIFLLPIITFGIILNYIFHLKNFGMDPYGNASIYMIDIFGSFPATLIAYYFGVVLVLVTGLQACMLLDRATSKVTNTSKVDTDTAITEENGSFEAENVCEELLKEEDCITDFEKTDASNGTEVYESSPEIVASEPEEENVPSDGVHEE